MKWTLKTAKWIILIIIILAIIAFMVLELSSQTVQRKATWDRYLDYGSPDVVGFNLYEIEIDTLYTPPDTSILRRLNPEFGGIPDLNNVEYYFMLPTDGQIYHFVMTAIDSAGNESIYSNVASVKAPKSIIPPRNVQIQ